MNSALFVSSQTSYSIELIGPTRGDNHWQAKDGKGFAARDFTIDWKGQQAICPMGKQSNSRTPAIDKLKNQVVKIKFATTDCQVCHSCEKCTRSTLPCRTITIQPQAQHEALLEGRKREQTEQHKRSMPNARGSKEPWRKAFGRRRCGAHAMLVKRKRTCNI